MSTTHLVSGGFRRGGFLLAVLLAAAGDVPRLTAQEAAPGETAADIATRSLLDALEDREMPDVALTVIAGVAADPEASATLKRELLFRRAAALIGVSRGEADRDRRNELLDEAEAALDEFLEQGEPTARQAIAAYTQKGNLLVERGRSKIEQADRPGAVAADELRAEAARCFDEAVAAFGGGAAPREKITTVTNAEDAVLRALRQVDQAIIDLKGSEKAAAEDGPPPQAGRKAAGRGGRQTDPPARAAKPAAKPRRLAAGDRRRLQTLEAEQESLRAKLIQTRLIAAAALFEKAKAFPAESQEWTAALKDSTERFTELAKKYPTKGGGLLALAYKGRNEAVQGEWETALDTLAPLTVINERTPLAILLRSRALNTALECMLALEQYDRFEIDARRFVLQDVDRLPGARLDADWLGLKYRAAMILKAQADAFDPQDAASRADRTRMLSDARRLAVEVAKADADFAAEAREIAAALGREVAAGAETFETAMDAAGVSLGMMQAEAAKAKAAADAAATDAAEKAAATHRNEALTKLETALGIAGIADPLAADPTADDALEEGSIDQVNRARYLLTYLLYDAQRYPASAALGRMLAERYPNATGSRQAAKIAMAAWQQAARRGTEEDRAAARAGATELAGIILETWPDSAEAADAAVIAIGASADDPAAVVTILDRVPSASPRQAEILLRGGIALWQAVQKARRLEAEPGGAGQRDRWKAAAQGALDEGLAAVAALGSLPAGAVGSLAVAAAVSRVQIAMEDGDEPRAEAVLEHPIYGPWTLFEAGTSPALGQGPLAEATLTLALRHFIQRQDFRSAERAMAGLEAAAGQGEAASDKLSAMYLSMGRDLQDQLTGLTGESSAGDPEARERARRILGGFEKFLDRVAARDRKISSQLWVATTYLSLGQGQKAGDAVTPAKASEYLEKSARAYQTLLDRTDDPEVARFESAIRLQVARIYQELRDWERAQEQIDWILADAKRQNSLDAQRTAAEILQAAAGAAAGAGDGERANSLFYEAVSGRTGAVVIWGWGPLANKLARQGLAGGGDQLERAREIFFNARLQVARCLLARARLPGRGAEERTKRLETAKTAILMTRKLYPDLGGEVLARQYEQVLREVQEELGDEPSGFAEPAAGSDQAALSGSSPGGGTR